MCAAAACAGALLAKGSPAHWGLIVVAISLVVRQPLLLAVGLAVWSSSMAHHDWAMVTAPVPRVVTGMATIAGDPMTKVSGTSAEITIEGRRFEVVAGGHAAAALAEARFGQEALVTAESTGEQRCRWSCRRHVAGRLRLQTLELLPARHGVFELSTEVRYVIERGSSMLEGDERALFTGLVFGRDERLSVTRRTQMRNAGLSHLTAVSGQNIVLLLGIVAPAVAWLRGPARYLTLMSIIVFFVVLTRAEPSVLRAGAMAGSVLLGQASGRPISTVRALAFAVTGVVLFDPLIVGRAGFVLSVSACLGIAMLAGPLARSIPGPPALASIIATTAAAQIGVTPALLVLFGPGSAAALPANVLAAPAAGVTMVWGLVVGIPAGLVGGTVAGVLHLPTRFMLRWILGVSEIANGPLAGRVLGITGLAVTIVLARSAFRLRSSRAPAPSQPDHRPL